MSEFTLQHISRPPLQASSGPAPLLILLHGVGSNEDDLMGLAPELDPRFFVVSARAPVTLQQGAYGWYKIQYTVAGMSMDMAEGSAGLAALLKFVDEVVAAHPVDASRIYLAGFSQGCIMGMAAVLANPRKFAGLVGMSGRLITGMIPNIAKPEDLGGFPMMIQHGLYDDVIEIQYGRAIQEYFSKLPVDLEYKEYPMAHQVSRESLNDIAAWLRKQLDASTIGE